MKSLIIAIALLTFGIKVPAFDWKAQKNQAQSSPYQWIYDTHAFVDEMLEKYPAEKSEG